MKLSYIDICGYKRFRGHCRLRTDTKLVAILGPNQSGKTSLLSAIEHLSGKPFQTSGENSQASRGEHFDDNHVYVHAFFRIDRDDLPSDLLDKGEPLIGKPRLLDVWVSPDGEISAELKPDLVPDRAAWRKLCEQIQRTQQSPLIRNLDEPTAIEFANLAEQATTALAETKERLPDAAQQLLAAFAEWIEDVSRESGSPKYIIELAEQLRDVVSVESTLHPREVAIKSLLERVPRFVLFDEEDRNLRSAYTLAEVLDPSRALLNLAKLAELALPAVITAQQQGDPATVRNLLEKANRVLHNRFCSLWRQSNVQPSLDMDGDALRIFIGSADKGWATIAETSDGMRWFVALASCLGRTDQGAVILLVDEAERHLHYDAQADLIQMLASQTSVEKVIYTTHSAGCLPEDLTASIRIIVPDPDEEKSRIENCFWEVENQPGLTALLVGMGARTFAFASVRRAVVTEGPSDCILLPPLLREATRSEVLSFQTVPGASSASQSGVADLNLQAARVAFFLDSDSAGNAIAKKLKKAGIEEERIVQVRSKNCEVEDFISADVFCKAVNCLLADHHDSPPEFMLENPESTGRVQMLKQWCEKNGINTPAKTALARAIIDEAEPESLSLLSENYREELLEVHRRFATLLELDSNQT